MKNFENIKKILWKNKKSISQKFKVKEIAVFGSFVRGEQKRNSDVDILVDFFEPVSFFSFLDLEEYLGKLLGSKVDLVSKKALKPRIGKFILQEMVAI